MQDKQGKGCLLAESPGISRIRPFNKDERSQDASLASEKNDHTTKSHP